MIPHLSWQWSRRKQINGQRDRRRGVLMSKFHEEFFRKGSAKHDELVILTIEKFENIFKNTIYPKIEANVLDRAYGGLDNKVWICSEENKPVWCNLKKKCAHTVRDDSEKPYCYRRPSYYKDSRAITCKYYGSTQNKDDWSQQNKSACLQTGALMVKLVEFKILRAETEKICKAKNGFIIGYADLLFKLQLEYIVHLKILEDWIWKNFSTYSLSIDIIAECKPELETWGGTLRQVKTYLDILSTDNNDPTYGLITTFTEVSPKVMEIIEKEDVFLVCLSPFTIDSLTQTTLLRPKV